MSTRQPPVIELSTVPTTKRSSSITFRKAHAGKNKQSLMSISNSPVLILYTYTESIKALIIYTYTVSIKALIIYTVTVSINALILYTYTVSI